MKARRQVSATQKHDFNAINTYSEPDDFYRVGAHAPSGCRAVVHGRDRRAILVRASPGSGPMDDAARGGGRRARRASTRLDTATAKSEK